MTADARRLPRQRSLRHYTAQAQNQEQAVSVVNREMGDGGS
jgi:hypothetical protein